MDWIKRGVVWTPSADLWWARKYATCPTPFRRQDGTLRLFIQCRDENNVGRIGYVDVDPEDPLRVLKVSDEPVLDCGAPGAFDDNGVFQTTVIRMPDGRVLMYYVGFELCHHIRYRLLTGLAVSHDDGDSFQRVKATPVLERSSAEMYFRCGNFVLPRQGGGVRMWYVAGSEWEEIDGKSMPIYDIRYIESDDGITWPEEGRVVLPVDLGREHGFGRPYIIEEAGLFRMFYSIRGRFPRAYHLGYAESPDGFNWTRKDEEMNLEASAEGWDSESVEYSAVVESAGRTFCFYNGNDFGVTGFGLAELQP